VGDPSYQHDSHRFADLGMQLSVPPDAISSSQYSRLINARSVIEGRLETRGSARTLFVVTGSIHTIFRLNQPSSGAVGERLVAAGSSLYAAPLPQGNIPSLLPPLSPPFDGTPLSIISFRYDGSPTLWAIIANGGKMAKHNYGYTQQLGLLPPLAAGQPSASVGAAGNLTGSYQWIYTYVNTATLSESNPSLASTAGGGTGTETKRPTASVTPASGSDAPSFFFGGSAFTNPGNAFDGNNATFASGTTNSGQHQVTMTVKSFTAGSAYSSLTLHVLFQAGGNASGSIFYSTDGGTTWNFMPGGGANTQNEIITNLPPSTDLTALKVFFGSDFGSAPDVWQVFEVWTVGILQSGTLGGTLALTNQSAKVCVQTPSDTQETAIRLYRIGGTLADAYRLVSQSLVTSLVQGVCGAGFLEIDDNNSDISIAAQPTLNTDNDMPVTSIQATNQTLKAIWGFGGRVLGCGDPARPDAVYFSKVGNADAWPSQNWVVTASSGDEIMNGLEWNLRCYAWGRERLYQLLLGVQSGITFTPATTPCKHGLKGRWAFCVGEKGIYFVAKDGIYLTAGGEEQSITDAALRPLFPVGDSPGQIVGTFAAPDMTQEDALRLAAHNGEIWFDYQTVGSNLKQRLVYNERVGRWRSEAYTDVMNMSYSEPGTVSSLLMGTTNGNVRQGDSAANIFGSGDTPVLAEIHTGSLDQGQPLNLKEYGNVLIDMDPNGATITITPYINAEAIIESVLVVSGVSGRQKFSLGLSDIFGLNISFDIQWGTSGGQLPILYQYDVLYRLEPVALQHWESPGMSLGQAYFTAKETYVTLRSGGLVNMTLTADNGTPVVYSIPSTGGLKQKVYLLLQPTKCKLLRIAFDSTSDFRLYRDESELRVRGWNKTGYDVIPIYGSEELTVQSVDQALSVLSGALRPSSG